MQKNEIIRVKITDVNNLGCGVGHLENGQTVFVRGAVTGEEIEAKIIKAAQSYLVAKTEKLITPSPYRCEEELCAFPKGCGGCAYRNITYAHELELKQNYVKNAFRKAGLANVTVESTVSTGVVEGYRNKAQYPMQKNKDGKTEAGFFANLTHRVVPANNCLLQPSIFGKLLTFFCNFCDRYHLSCYDETKQKGLLRHLYLRMAPKTGEVLFCPVICGKSIPHERELIAELQQKFPEVKSAFINVNQENTNVVLGEEFRLLYGKESIEDELCGLRFSISPGAFYQVNHDACEKLYGLAKEKAGLSGKELLLDLYCGIGTIGLSMADSVEKVLGMEIVPEAVIRAKENAERNAIKNADFYCGDAGDPKGILQKAKELNGSLENAVIVLDPPRKGTTKELIAAIAEEKIQKVVYVSCNPDTLARDCAVFAELGYRIGNATPVDLFPRTGHVETVVLLSGKKVDGHICIDLNIDRNSK